MAVAYILEFEGASLDQYDQVMGKMGLEPGGQAPPGALFHWVTATDDGIRVTDVWESDVVFQAFSEEQIGPFTAEVGLGEPQVTRHDVHNHVTAQPSG